MSGRILGVDYGKKRIGLAVTDTLQIIVSGLDTIDHNNFRKWLLQYCKDEKVEKIIFGEPIHADGTHTYLWNEIQKEVVFIKQEFPDIEIDYQDESFTSSDAREILMQSAKKKKRRDKNNIDKLSAILILQKYLGHI